MFAEGRTNNKKNVFVIDFDNENLILFFLYFFSCISDQICAVSRGRITEEEGGCTHSDVTRDRRHQQ